MSLEEAKNNLLKKVRTPIGEIVLYGINCMPEHEAIGLIFYVDGKQKIIFSEDCEVL